MIVNDPLHMAHKGIVGHAFAFIPSKPGNVTAPPQTPLSNQILEALAAQSVASGPTLAINQATQPGFGALSLQDLQQQIFGQNATAATPGTTETLQIPQFGKLGKLKGYTPTQLQIPGSPALPAVPGTLAQGIGANTIQRGADIGNVQAMGPAAEQAILSANPFLASGLGQGLNYLNSPTQAGLNQTGANLIAQGGNLSPQEQQNINQQTLAGFSQRGLAEQPGTLGAQLLGQDAYSRARQLENIQTAQGIQQAGAQGANQFAQTAQQTMGDPFQTVLGRSSGAGLFGTGGAAPTSSGVGPGSALAFSQAMFSPTSNYFQDYFNTGYNANVAAQLGNQNAQSAYSSGLLGLYGGVIRGVTDAAASYALHGSDRRLKEKIKKVGKTDEGIPVYSFKYKGVKQRFIGSMAQDVEKIHPEAVVTDPVTGLKSVDTRKSRTPFAYDFLTGQTRKAA